MPCGSQRGSGTDGTSGESQGNVHGGRTLVSADVSVSAHGCDHVRHGCAVSRPRTPATGCLGRFCAALVTVMQTRDHPEGKGLFSRIE